MGAFPKYATSLALFYVCGIKRPRWRPIGFHPLSLKGIQESSSHGALYRRTARRPIMVAEEDIAIHLVRSMKLSLFIVVRCLEPPGCCSFA